MRLCILLFCCKTTPWQSLWCNIYFTQFCTGIIDYVRKKSPYMQFVSRLIVKKHISLAFFWLSKAEMNVKFLRSPKVFPLTVKKKLVVLLWLIFKTFMNYRKMKVVVKLLYFSCENWQKVDFPLIYFTRFIFSSFYCASLLHMAAAS